MMYKPDQSAWEQFPKDMQLKNIAAELTRATQALLHTEALDRQKIKSAYDRALALIDASLADPKWSDERGRLYELRDAVASLYGHEVHPAITRFIARELQNR